MMWLLSYLTDFIVHTMVVFGIIGIIVSFFIPSNPLTLQYALPTKIISILVLCVGIFFEGTIYKDKVWEARVAEMEKQVALKDAESSEANTKLVEALKNNEILRKERKNGTKQIVNQVVSKYDGNCVLSNAFIRVHDSASQDQLPEGSRQSDGDPSNVKPSELLNTVVDNYETCYSIRDKLIKWQEWYKTNKEIYER